MCMWAALYSAGPCARRAGTVVPVAIVFRSPAASMFAMRAVGILYGVGRFLPPQVRWRLFSRLWVGAILYLERVGTKAVEAANKAAGPGPKSKKTPRGE